MSVQLHVLTGRVQPFYSFNHLVFMEIGTADINEKNHFCVHIVHHGTHFADTRGTVVMFPPYQAFDMAGDSPMPQGFGIHCNQNITGLHSMTPENML